MKNIRPLRTDEDYEWALAEIERYFDKEPDPGTPEGDRFDVLAALIADYEAKHWPVEAPDPIAAIRYVMEARSLTQSDLADVIGSSSRASEVLRRKRPLTMKMAHQIHEAWRIPAEVLIRPYHTEQ
jgi:HTH-type transcriptional regulator / antitoxin HigA